MIDRPERSDPGERGPVAVVPAAGRGRRFGGSKLVAIVGGQPMLERVIRSLLDAGIPRVVVVLAPDSAADAASVPVLGDPRVRTVVNPDPERGMFSTVQTGIAAAAGDPIVVLPGDVPFVRPATIRLVLDAARRDARCVVPTHDGRRGHPVAIPGVWREAIVAADPSRNLSEVLKSLDARGQLELPVEDSGVLRDVDVPGDLSR
jgi:CTP:molybdopterin cytidylyltransferase MocA